MFDELSRTSDNRYRKVNKAPLEGNGKKRNFRWLHFINSTLFAHFTETRVQRNAVYKLNGSNSKKKKRYAKLIFSVRDNKCLKKDNSKSLTRGSQIVLTKCYRDIWQEHFKTRKKKKLKNSLKSGTGKADFASMIEDLSLFKINSNKPFFTQKLCWLDNPENTHRFQLMVSPFGLQASAQCTYSYNDLLCAKVLVRHF